LITDQRQARNSWRYFGFVFSDGLMKINCSLFPTSVPGADCLLLPTIALTAFISIIGQFPAANKLGHCAHGHARIMLNLGLVWSVVNWRGGFWSGPLSRHADQMEFSRVLFRTTFD